MSARWPRTRAAAGSVAVGALLLAGGALTGRADVAVLGAAPLVAGVWDWRRRPVAGVSVRLTASEGVPQPGRIESVVEVAAPDGVPGVLVGLRRGGRELAEVLVAVRGTRRLPLVVRTVRTGLQEVATVDAQGIGAGAASVSVPTPPSTRETVVLPGRRALGALPLPPRLRGLTGAHESRRPGEGGGLRDVHPFTPGDRLRRVDWRVTARRSPDLTELYVRREHALAEAVVVLVLDSRDDVGPDPLTWRGPVPPRAQDPTSLDLARGAAASVAEAYLGQGDRVGLDDLGTRRRPLPPGGGRRQLDRIRHALAVTRPQGEPALRVRAPRLPSGALVCVFSTFLDDEAALAAAQWRHLGHRVLAVDVLPTLHVRHLGERERIAVRLIALAREDRLADLADRDVEVVTWREAPEIALATLARGARRRAGAGSR
ncbi:DUF58 domain-containing protein [Cellulomonas sp.]|uniref:DUF58 domain-containing protein n=1 Tax=Cellulomonas sp. TaxID=40001 RepID=UPI001B0BE0C9|nr:DUF58 domain-containing protein [Cellulomonas sp.]MBO9554552.1 DUF58 domain-containing protein [Cellulomonas sp.]